MGTGAQWPGSFPGAGSEDVSELLLVEVATEPTIEGAMRNVSGDIIARDASGNFNLRSPGGGITESEHEVADTLVHDVAEDYYMERTIVAGKTTNVTVYTDSTPSKKKIREAAITRSAGKVSQVVNTQYDDDGNAITGQVLTETVARVDGKVDTITGVES